MFHLSGGEIEKHFFAIPSLLLYPLETVLKSYLQDTTLVLQR